MDETEKKSKRESWSGVAEWVKRNNETKSGRRCERTK